jgi:hypothetical protein
LSVLSVAFMLAAELMSISLRHVNTLYGGVYFLNLFVKSGLPIRAVMQTLFRPLARQSFVGSSRCSVLTSSRIAMGRPEAAGMVAFRITSIELRSFLRSGTVYPSRDLP